MANTLTLKVMAEVVRRCAPNHHYQPVEPIENRALVSEGSTSKTPVLNGHPNQAQLLSDIGSGKRRLGDDDTHLIKNVNGKNERLETPKTSRPKTGPMSLSDWLNAQPKKR